MAFIKTIIEKLTWHSLREQPLIANSMEQIDRLAPEQRMALGTAFGLGITIILITIFVKGYSTLNTMKENIEGQRKDLQQLTSFGTEFQQFQTDIGRIQSEIRRRPKAFSLKAFVMGEITKIGIPQESVGSIKDQLLPAKGDLQESVVEIQLKHISLKRMTNLINGIERSQNVTRVKGLHIKPRKEDKRYLDATIIVSTITEIKS